jgi:hypothetical protein
MTDIERQQKLQAIERLAIWSVRYHQERAGSIEEALRRRAQAVAVDQAYQELRWQLLWARRCRRASQAGFGGSGSSSQDVTRVINLAKSSSSNHA